VASVITALTNKSKGFVRVRISVIVYLVIVLVVNSVFKALLSLMWEYAWYPVLLNEIAVFLMVAFVCCVLAPRNNGMFLTSINDLIPLLRAQHFINHNEENDNEVDLEPWDLSKTMLILWPQSPEKISANKNQLGPLSVAYDEKYAKEQEKPREKLSEQKVELNDD